MRLPPSPSPASCQYRRTAVGAPVRGQQTGTVAAATRCNLSAHGGSSELVCRPVAGGGPAGCTRNSAASSGGGLQATGRREPSVAGARADRPSRLPDRPRRWDGGPVWQAAPEGRFRHTERAVCRRLDGGSCLADSPVSVSV